MHTILWGKFHMGNRTMPNNKELFLFDKAELNESRDLGTETERMRNSEIISTSLFLAMKLMKQNQLQIFAQLHSSHGVYIMNTCASHFCIFKCMKIKCN